MREIKDNFNDTSYLSNSLDYSYNSKAVNNKSNFPKNYYENDQNYFKNKY